MDAVDELRLPPHPGSVSLARHFVERVLERLEPRPDADTIETAVLLTSELVTNAVLHAGRADAVRIRRGSGLRIEVDDPSKHPPIPRRHDQDSVAGRGLELVELLASGYGVVRRMTGKSTWFELGGEPLTTSSWHTPGVRNGLRPPAAPQTRPVSLLRVPIRLYRVLVKYNEALLREYSLLQVQDAGITVAERVSEADRVRTRLAEAVAQTIAAGGAAEYVDLHVEVDARDVEAVRALLQVYVDAERLARNGLTITPPLMDELDALRQWWMRELVDQHDLGSAPVAWQLPDDVERREPAELPDLPWRMWQRFRSQAAVLTDTTHRVVAISEPAALLCGWDAEDLRGHSLNVLIPPRLRERHLAGYAAHVLTGRGNVLGHPLHLPMRHHDGSEVPVVMTLTKQVIGEGTWFFAWFEPVAGTAPLSLGAA